MTHATFRAESDQALDLQSAYKTLLAQTGESKNRFDAAEVRIAALTSRMLAAAAVKYGRDSNEYEQAGGRKTSNRRRATRAARIEPAFLSKVA